MATTFSYNNIVLDMAATSRISHLPEFDQRNNYIRSKIRFDVEGWMNPSATAYVSATQAAAPTVTVLPASTLAAVRHALSQARQKLIYAVDGIVVLQSPLTGQACDVVGGPTPIGMPEVTAVIGSKSMHVRMSIETVINECQGKFATTDRPIVISNLWEASDIIDDDWFTTRHVEGKAVFRMDDLAALRRFPDDYRGWLFFPLMRGFKRENVRVAQAEDGVTLYYAFDDVQQPSFPLAFGLTKMEGVHRDSIVSGDFDESVFNTASALADITFSTAAEAAAGAAGVLPGSGAAVPIYLAARQIFQAGRQILNIARNFTPKNITDVTIRAWGDPRSNMENLSLAAWKVLNSRINTLVLKFSTRYTASEVRNFTKKFVEIHTTFVTGTRFAAAVGLNTVFNNNNQGVGIQPGFSSQALQLTWRIFPNDTNQTVTGPAALGPIWSNNASNWQIAAAQPPYSSGTRGAANPVGTGVGSTEVTNAFSLPLLVARELLAPCAVPSTPLWPTRRTANAIPVGTSAVSGGPTSGGAQ